MGKNEKDFSHKNVQQKSPDKKNQYDDQAKQWSRKNENEESDQDTGKKGYVNEQGRLPSDDDEVDRD
jgi:hypothetical protein